MDSAIQSK